jgi:simple sugar transport system permease protein
VKDRFLQGLRALVPTLVAVALAAVAATLIAVVVLLVTGADPAHVLSQMWSFGLKPANRVTVVNRAAVYYLSAVAVAIGFRLNLFNIGVDGQYRLAAMLAAAAGAAVSLPAPLHVGLILVVAVLVGAAWAGIAAVLRATRGVSEVISTIMLNFIATGLVAFLLNPKRLAVAVAGSNNIGTKPIAASGQVPGIHLLGGPPTAKVFGLIVLVVLVGVGYGVLVRRTRFGFDLKAVGLSPGAAAASGVDVKRMVVVVMLISGGIAGLVGMPQLLGASHSYSLDFPTGLGFTGIAIALLGRNHPVGIAIGSLVWAFLDVSSIVLNFLDVAPEVVKILQGSIVISVVVAYELVRRQGLRRQARFVGTATAPAATPQGAAA